MTQKAMQSVIHAHVARVKSLKASVMGTYFDTKDSKDVDGLQEQLTLLKGVARASIGNKIIRAKLFFKQVITTAANTELANSYGLAPSASSSEWASYKALYDEVRIDAIDIHFRIHVSLGGAFTFASLMAAIGYDSTYNFNPVSAADVLESAQSKLLGVGGAYANNAISPDSVNSTGLHHFHIKILRGPVANAASVTGGTGIIANFPGEWMTMQDSADSVGYRRVYYPAQGAANVINYEEMITFHCSFRERT